MLTELEVGQYRAFGYVVLCNCLSQDEVRGLAEAFDRVISSASELDDFGTRGTKRLSTFVEADDSFSSLVEHPKIMEAMRDIDGTEFLYPGTSDLTSNMDDVFWHTDGNPSRQPPTAKTAIYLDDLSEGNGALNIIPGSHHPQFSAALYRLYPPLGEEYRKRSHDPRSKNIVPGVTSIYTKPGDVVLWDNRLWHSAWKRQDGKPRRNMFINYVRDPKDDPIATREVRDHVAYYLHELDRPFVYGKRMMSKAGPGLKKMAARLSELGVAHVIEDG